MFKLVRAGVVAALVVVPIVAGCQAQAQAPATPAPTAIPLATRAPTPAPTAAPVATPTPATAAPSTGSAYLVPSDAGRTLVAGHYEVGLAFAEPFQFDVPAGFALDAIREGNVALSGQHGWLGAFAADAVFPDPCRIAGDPVEVDGGDALLAALRDIQGFTTGTITESTIDGRRARSFVISNEIDTSTAGCTRDLMLPIFRSLGNPDGEATNGGTHQVVWVIDGMPKTGLGPDYTGPVLVVADSYATDADLAMLEGIVKSMNFD